jgi:hypothetical protein
LILLLWAGMKQKFISSLCILRKRGGRRHRPARANW